MNRTVPACGRGVCRCRERTPMTLHRIVRRAGAPIALGVAGVCPPAFASCGSAACTLVTDRFVQGSWDRPGFYLDLRGEYLDQDRLLSGSQRIGADQVTEETIERET